MTIAPSIGRQMFVEKNFVKKSTIRPFVVKFIVHKIIFKLIVHLLVFAFGPHPSVNPHYAEI